MFSSINKINCLIVEDDQFKMEGIKTHLKDIFDSKIDIIECHALSSATASLAEHEFHLAIIDMSIHSHDPKAGAGSPIPLSSGGLDVLFEIIFSQNQTQCIILTQYPDIDIESLPIPVDLAKAAILEKFDIEVAGCIRYLENDKQWKDEMSIILRQL